MTVGQHTFGLRQLLHLPGDRRTTTICLGSTTVESGLQAVPLAAIIICPTGVLMIAVVTGIGIWTAKKK